MQFQLTDKPAIKLVGLTARTNKNNEMIPALAKIGALVSRFWMQNLGGLISDRKNPGITFSVYTDYESDEHGDYTYFIGEEVNSFANIPEGLVSLTIPAAKYQKFTTPPGKIPEVVINAWQQIWKMSSADFRGKRAYRADFEYYDQRAADPDNASLDIYIGIE